MTRFLAKVAAQKLLSALPGGRQVWSLLQDHISRSTLPTAEMVRQSVEVALTYIRLLQSVAGGEVLPRGPHVDVGAGWHFTIPFVFWRLGFDEQHLIDVERLARADLVFPVAQLVGGIDLGKGQLRRLPPPNDATLDSYLSRLGIFYHAPLRARWPLPDSSAVLVTSTATLYYPPRKVVHDIFGEAARVLRPGGRFMASFMLYDPYTDFDHSLCRFNFLRYSEQTWNRWFNSPIRNYNRLRPSDYAALFDGLPFTAEVWAVQGGSLEDLHELDRISVTREFAAYDRQDLAATGLTFVMRRL